MTVGEFLDYINKELSNDRDAELRFLVTDSDAEDFDRIEPNGITVGRVISIPGKTPDNQKDVANIYFDIT
jgi:hypothetical protein